MTDNCSCRYWFCSICKLDSRLLQSIDDGELTHIQGFYVGFLWTYFSFYTVCGFFVHQWDIQVKTLFKVSYVSQ